MDQCRVGDAAMAGAVLTGGRGDVDALPVSGRFEVVCVGADGVERWRETRPNLVVTVGRNSLLDTYFRGSAYTAALFVGLKGSGSIAAADTMSSHAGWSEIVPYSNATRVAYAPAASGSGSITNSATPAVFTINATATVAGCFITTSSTKSGTTGTLFSAVDFSSARGVISGDVLNVTYTCSTV